MQNSLIHLYLGPMWAGKTTTLISRIDLARDLDLIVWVLKPAVDDRYAARRITSHDGRSCPATLVRDDQHLAEVLNLAAGVADIIAIDEIQFFQPSIAELLVGLGGDIEVLCAGLDRDCFGEMFPSTEALLPAANEVSYFKAQCECGKPAGRTQRFGPEGRPVTSGEVVQVGGADLYRPVCSECWTAPAGATGNS